MLNLLTGQSTSQTGKEVPRKCERGVLKVIGEEVFSEKMSLQERLARKRRTPPALKASQLVPLSQHHKCKEFELRLACEERWKKQK